MSGFRSRFDRTTLDRQFSKKKSGSLAASQVSKVKRFHQWASSMQSFRLTTENIGNNWKKFICVI